VGFVCLKIVVYQKHLKEKYVEKKHPTQLRKTRKLYDIVKMAGKVNETAKITYHVWQLLP
jgi:hypothetical protein